MPAGTVAVPDAMVQPITEWNWKPSAGAAVSVSGVAGPTGEGFPKASRSSTVSTCEHTPATAVRAGVTKTITDGAPAITVTFWPAGLSPAAVAVTATVATAVPRT